MSQESDVKNRWIEENVEVKEWMEDLSPNPKKSMKRLPHTNKTLLACTHST